MNNKPKVDRVIDDVKLKEQKEKEKNELREKLADLQHEIWSQWMKYLFDVSYPIDDGSVWVTVKNVERWKRQIETPYSELSEKEKNSDRRIADKILEALK